MSVGHSEAGEFLLFCVASHSHGLTVPIPLLYQAAVVPAVSYCLEHASIEKCSSCAVTLTRDERFQ
jgi:hypothetical protein